MNRSTLTVGAALALFTIACGGKNGAAAASDGACSSGTCTLGPSGGSVRLPDGPTLIIPPSALGTTVSVTIAQAAPAPAGGLSPVFEFGPPGTTFARPVTIEFAMPAGTPSASIYWTQPGSTTAFAPIPTTVAGIAARAELTHFSRGYLGQACTPGDACVPANPCHEGTTTCAGAPACADTGTSVADGGACGDGGSCSGGACVGTPAVAAPSFSPPAGIYAVAQWVAIVTSTAGAELHYTADGSTPTSASPLYVSSVQVATSRTLKALAVHPGMTNSPVAAASYVIGAASFCSQLSSAIIGRFVTCEHANPSIAARDQFVSCQALAAAVTAGRIQFNPHQAQACLDAMATSSCSLFPLNFTADVPWPAACAQALAGQVPDSGACSSRLDCASGYCGGGLCAPHPLEGQPCSMSGHESVREGALGGCAPGLYCAVPPGSGTPRCRVPATLGATCVGLGGCAAGLYCASDSMCAAQKTSGECTGDFQICAPGHVCQGGQPPVCVPVVGEGAACGIGVAVCGRGWNCLSGHCAKAAALATACADLTSCVPEASLDFVCVPCDGGRCNGGICSPYATANQGCSSSLECASGYCSGTCVPMGGY